MKSSILQLVQALLSGVLSNGGATNIMPLEDAVYNVTITAQGPVTTAKQVVKPAQMVGLEAPLDTVYYAKLGAKKYQAAIVYSNDGTGRPQQSYAVAWDATAKKPLGLLRLEMLNTSDHVGALASAGLSFVKDPTLSGILQPNKTMSPVDALLADAALPYTYIDGWSCFGQKGENFRGGIVMAWANKETKDFVAKVLGGRTITEVIDLIKQGPWAELVKNLDAEAVLKLKAIIENGAGLGASMGYGFGTLAFDKKAQTASISKIVGQNMVVDVDSSYLPYEMWNIYTGRAETELSADFVEFVQTLCDDGVIPEEINFGGKVSIPGALIPETISAALKLTESGIFTGYGTFDVKYNKSGSKTLTKTTDPDERIAAFLKAAKAPKFVTAEDVIDLRVNYLKTLFDGSPTKSVSLGAPLSYDIGWPMTVSNVLAQTTSLVDSYFGASNNVLTVKDGNCYVTLLQGMTEYPAYTGDFGVKQSDFGTVTNVTGIAAIEKVIKTAIQQADKRTTTENPDEYARRYREFLYELTQIETLIEGTVLPLWRDAKEAEERGLGVWYRADK